MRSASGAPFGKASRTSRSTRDRRGVAEVDRACEQCVANPRQQRQQVGIGAADGKGKHRGIEEELSGFAAEQDRATEMPGKLLRRR